MSGASTEKRGAAALTVAVCAALILGLFLSPRLSDFYFAGRIADNMRYFQDYSSRIAAGDLPYRDFAIEYPPVTAAALAALAPFSKSFDVYTPAFLMMNLALWLLCMAVALRTSARTGGSSIVTAALFAFLSMATGPIMMVSLDLLPALLTLIAVSALTANRRGAAFAVLGAAAAAKGFPILLFPLFLMIKESPLIEGELGSNAEPHIRKPLRDIGAFAGSFLVLGCFPAIFSVKNFVGSYLYHSERGLEVASVYSAVLLQFRHAGLAMHTLFDHNSWNLVVPGVSGPLARVSMFIQLAFLAVALYVAWRSLRRGRVDARGAANLAIMVILAFLIPFKVASPQYLVWLLPLAAVAWVEPFQWPPVLLYFAVGHIQQWIYPWNWFRLVNMSPGPAAALLFEKVLLIALFVWSLAAAGKNLKPESELK